MKIPTANNAAAVAVETNPQPSQPGTAEVYSAFLDAREKLVGLMADAGILATPSADLLASTTPPDADTAVRAAVEEESDGSWDTHEQTLDELINRMDSAATPEESEAWKNTARGYAAGGQIATYKSNLALRAMGLDPYEGYSADDKQFMEEMEPAMKTAYEKYSAGIPFADW